MPNAAPDAVEPMSPPNLDREIDDAAAIVVQPRIKNERAAAPGQCAIVAEGCVDGAGIAARPGEAAPFGASAPAVASPGHAQAHAMAPELPAQGQVIIHPLERPARRLVMQLLDRARQLDRMVVEAGAVILVVAFVGEGGVQRAILELQRAGRQRGPGAAGRPFFVQALSQPQ
jgi:hypothetical protein